MRYCFVCPECGREWEIESAGFLPDGETVICCAAPMRRNYRAENTLLKEGWPTGRASWLDRSRDG